MINREVGNRLGEGITLGNIGGLHRLHGRTAEARRCFQQALEIHRAVSFNHGQAHWLWRLGELEAEASSPAWVGLVDEAVEVAAGLPAPLAEALAVRARLRLAEDPDGAARDVQQARELGQGGRTGVAVALAEARVHHMAGQQQEARASWDEAHGLLADVGVWSGSLLGQELQRVRRLLY